LASPETHQSETLKQTIINVCVIAVFLSNLDKLEKKFLKGLRTRFVEKF